ncbi:MAG: TetR/AcrR family transcriptional regulator [Rhizobiaceae bacterium]|nr:TetR/AcrR family transcriptional regulator [Rhizobiaceae bacterium]
MPIAEPASDEGVTDGRLLRGQSTRKQVLDAAERLFAEFGFDGVSIRQIAQEATVPLASVGFHGGTKIELFKTVIERRVNEVSAARSEALARMKARPQPPTLHELVAAYLGPYLDCAVDDDPQRRAYARLVARMSDHDRWYPTVRDLYDPLAREYLSAIAEAGPAVDRERLSAAFVFSIAAMLHLVSTRRRIGGLLGNENVDRDPSIEAMRGALIDFCVGGIRGAGFEQPNDR